MIDPKIKNNIIVQKNSHYFDYTASGLAYTPIEKDILQILQTYANIHSEVGIHVQKTQSYYNKAREDLKQALEISDDFYILPCGTGASGAIKKLQEILGLYIPPKTKQRYKINPKDKPLVIIGPFEHHSNEISFREALCDVIRVPLKEDQTIDIEFLENTLEKNKHRELIGSFCVASNVTGILNPREKISELLRKYNALVLFDAASSSAYFNVKSNLYDAMFLSPHKLLGGVGSCGLLIIKKSYTIKI